MILSLLIFNIAFWLCIANLKKKGWVEAGRRWEAHADHSDNEAQA
jgi:hypothetical protein